AVHSLIYRQGELMKFLYQEISQFAGRYCVLIGHHLTDSFIRRVSDPRNHRNRKNSDGFRQLIVVVRRKSNLTATTADNRYRIKPPPPFRNYSLMPDERKDPLGRLQKGRKPSGFKAILPRVSVNKFKKIRQALTRLHRN